MEQTEGGLEMYLTRTSRNAQERVKQTIFLKYQDNKEWALIHQWRNRMLIFCSTSTFSKTCKKVELLTICHRNRILSQHLDLSLVLGSHSSQLSYCISSCATELFFVDLDLEVISNIFYGKWKLYLATLAFGVYLIAFMEFKIIPGQSIKALTKLNQLNFKKGSCIMYPQTMPCNSMQSCHTLKIFRKNNVSNKNHLSK